MIDFAGVKAITIPEGKVKLITRKSDGVVLWKGGYKNWARYSTEDDGVTIYNGGKGYKDGYRVRSGGADAQNDTTSITGYMPFVKGDKMYIYPPFVGLNVNNTVNFYDNTYACLGQITDAGTYYGFCTTDFKTKVLNGVSVLDISQVTVSGIDSVAYVRVGNYIGGAIRSGSEMIITINEEIPETDIPSTFSMRTLTPEIIRKINEENTE